MSKIYWSWSNISGSLKRVWQNIYRGWNDSDCWNMQITIADFVLPRLKRFKETVHGYPANIIESDDYEEGMRQWKEIIDKMIYSFEVVSKDYDNIDLKDAGGKLEFVPIKDSDNCSLEYIGTPEQIQQHEIDMKEYIAARKAEHIKVQVGLELFAKHYEDLWD